MKIIYCAVFAIIITALILSFVSHEMSFAKTIDGNVKLGNVNSDFDIKTKYVDYSWVSTPSTLVSDGELDSLKARLNGSPAPQLAPHDTGMSFVDYDKSHFYIQDAKVKRIIDMGTEIKITAIAESENPAVFCHGILMETLGKKHGKAISIGQEFSETVQIPFEHQSHLPELVKTSDTANPFFEERTYLVLSD